MSTARHFDVIVTGSGAGGEGTATMPVTSGRGVAVVEMCRDVGGGCTHRAAIPGKAMRHTVERPADLRADPLFRRAVGAVEPSCPDLLERAGRVIARYEQGRAAATRIMQGESSTLLAKDMPPGIHGFGHRAADIVHIGRAIGRSPAPATRPGTSPRRPSTARPWPRPARSPR